MHLIGISGKKCYQIRIFEVYLKASWSLKFKKVINMETCSIFEDFSHLRVSRVFCFMSSENWEENEHEFQVEDHKVDAKNH